MVPLPRFRGGGRQTIPFSRGAFVRAPELCGTPVPKRRKSDLRQMPRSGNAGSIMIRHGARTKETNGTNERKRERKRNADRRGSPCCTGQGATRTLRRARSPVGVPLWLSPGGQLVPKAQRQAMLPGAFRSVRSCTAAPTGGRKPCAVPRALPAPKPSQCSEHLTRRSLCRRADARRRPSAEGTNPRPASTTLAPRQLFVTGWRPFARSERPPLLVGACGESSRIIQKAGSV